MPTSSKKDLVDRIAEKTQSKRITVKAVIQQLLDEITSELAQNNRRVVFRLADQGKVHAVE